MSSAPLLIESLDFRNLYGLQSDEDWDRAAHILAKSAKGLEAAGAEGLIIAANSMHRVYDRVIEGLNIPALHIAECVGRKMAADNVSNAALIGTRNVMTESFYRQRLVRHGIDLLPPDMDSVETLNHYIYDELVVGKVTRDAERALKTIITQKEQAGASAIILACTELELVVDIDANVLPIYDSTRIHCDAAADWIFGEDIAD